MLKEYLKRIKKIRPDLAIGTGLVLIGLILGGATLFNTYRAEHSAEKPVKHALENNQIKDNGDPLISGEPVHISIPSVNIDLKVIPGYYYPASNTWTLSLDSAQYGVMTAKPNNKQGDTFIYAHYRWGVFYNLPKIQSGATAIITTQNGHTFTYTFRNSVVTTPEDTSLFSYKGKPILVLQTCTGLWFQNRQLFTFDLTKAA